MSREKPAKSRSISIRLKWIPVAKCHCPRHPPGVGPFCVVLRGIVANIIDCRAALRSVNPSAVNSQKTGKVIETNRSSRGTSVLASGFPNRRCRESQAVVFRCSQVFHRDLRSPQLQFRRFANFLPCSYTPRFICFESLRVRSFAQNHPIRRLLCTKKIFPNAPYAVVGTVSAFRQFCRLAVFGAVHRISRYALSRGTG